MKNSFERAVQYLAMRSNLQAYRQKPYAGYRSNPKDVCYLVGREVGVTGKLITSTIRVRKDYPLKVCGYSVVVGLYRPAIYFRGLQECLAWLDNNVVTDDPSKGEYYTTSHFTKV